MDYEIKISDDKSFVVVDVKNPVSVEQALTFTRKSIELASKHNTNSYLIDLRKVRHKWSVFETYTFAKDLRGSGRQRLDRVALLTQPDDETFSFVETATVNQGYNTRVFTDYDEATAWLKG